MTDRRQPQQASEIADEEEVLTMVRDCKKRLDAMEGHWWNLTKVRDPDARDILLGVWGRILSMQVSGGNLFWQSVLKVLLLVVAAIAGALAQRYLGGK